MTLLLPLLHVMVRLTTVLAPTLSNASHPCLILVSRRDMLVHCIGSESAFFCNLYWANRLWTVHEVRMGCSEQQVQQNCWTILNLNLALRAVALLQMAFADSSQLWPTLQTSCIIAYSILQQVDDTLWQQISKLGCKRNVGTGITRML